VQVVNYVDLGARARARINKRSSQPSIKSNYTQRLYAFVQQMQLHEECYGLVQVGSHALKGSMLVEPHGRRRFCGALTHSL
jgi:hypothetical protein